MKRGLARTSLLLAVVTVSAAAQQPAPPQAPQTPPAGAPPPVPVLGEPQAPTQPAPGTAPATPPGYYVERAPSATSPTVPAPAPTERGYEPPPPGAGPVYEPPPPLTPRHVAPRNSLWLGARIGYFLPFGNVYARATTPDRNGFYGYVGVPWQDYAGSGVLLELDAGARLSRNYNVFAFWERGQLTSGNAEQGLYGGQDGSDTDFWGAGVRATTDADGFGLVTELALGYRRARATWSDGTELQFTDGILEGRIAVGADIRINELFAVSPLLSIGVGSFGDIERVLASGVSYTETRPLDAMDSHAWFTVGVGGHVDLFGSKR